MRKYEKIWAKNGNLRPKIGSKTRQHFVPSIFGAPFQKIHGRTPIYSVWELLLTLHVQRWHFEIFWYLSVWLKWNVCGALSCYRQNEASAHCQHSCEHQVSHLCFRVLVMLSWSECTCCMHCKSLLLWCVNSSDSTLGEFTITLYMSAKKLNTACIPLSDMCCCVAWSSLAVLQ